MSDLEKIFALNKQGKMKCPFRAGIRFEYQYIGPNTASGKQKSENYIEIAQHSVFEDCFKEECPFYNYNGLCERIGDY